ncbi:hypothetical protein D3C78_924080 [compost metagenome]
MGTRAAALQRPSRRRVWQRRGRQTGQRAGHRTDGRIVHQYGTGSRSRKQRGYDGIRAAEAGSARSHRFTVLRNVSAVRHSSAHTAEGRADRPYRYF